MGPKTQKPVSGKSRSGEENKEDSLKAVVLADTFETRFAPFTDDRPRCLLPLVNTPLIEYTLEFLASAGVQEVFLYGGAHVEKLETYINSSKWKLPTSAFKKLVFLRTIATCVGDVMRDLDQKHLITSDFITMSGDIVSNFPIEKALKAHQTRRQKDKNAIMTMLLRQASAGHANSIDSITPRFVIDPRKDRCLHYEEARHDDLIPGSVDPDIFSEPEIDIRQDLIDCRIDICTPDVLGLWSDNFDNQTPRRDFLYGVLKDHELNGKTIHTYIIQDHYAARVASLPSYDRISRDLVSGLVFPFSPDSNIFHDHAYARRRNNAYQEDGVVLAKSSIVGPRTVIGRGTSVGAGSTIVHSVVGRRCQIGKNVDIRDAYVWDDTTVGDDVRILKAIIGGNVHLGDNCSVEHGALVSSRVLVSPGTTVRSRSRLSTNFETAQASEMPIGTGENAMRTEEEADSVPWLGYKILDFAGSSSSLSSIDSDASEAPSSFAGSRSESFATTLSDEDNQRIDRFHHEAVSSLFERMQTGTAIQDIRVELVSLRLANNASDHQVRKAVAVAMMKHIQKQIDSGLETAADASRKTLTKYRDLVARAESQDTTADRVDFLMESQRDLVQRNDGGRILLFVAKDLYDLEVFGEEVFTEWWEDEKSRGDAGMARVRQSTAQFIEWLEIAESASEEEESE